MASIKSVILNKIKKRGKGHILFPSDFSNLGDYKGVRLALHRLAKEKEIVRLGQGIYLYPKEDPDMGILYPSMEDIAQAIAKRDHIKIRSTGVKAMNQLGLSTQVPLNVVFITDGPSKKIKIGKNTITFINASNKRMALKTDYLGSLIFALEEIGKDRLTEVQKEKVYSILADIPQKQIMQATKKAPTWIADFLITFINSQNDSMARTS